MAGKKQKKATGTSQMPMKPMPSEEQMLQKMRQMTKASRRTGK